MPAREPPAQLGVFTDGDAHDRHQPEYGRARSARLPGSTHLGAALSPEPAATRADPGRFGGWQILTQERYHRRACRTSRRSSSTRRSWRSCAMSFEFAGGLYPRAGCRAVHRRGARLCPGSGRPLRSHSDRPARFLQRRGRRAACAERELFAHTVEAFDAYLPACARRLPSLSPAGSGSRRATR